MKKVLVVVDMQKDFIDGALGFEGADKIIPGIISKIKEYEANNDEVVYTLDTHGENYMETQEGKSFRYRIVFRIRMDGKSTPMSWMRL